MNDEAALLAAIVSHPGEDTPRLAFADWLEENGQPDRAEFIRVQCRLAAVTPADPEWSALIDRDDELVLTGPTRQNPIPPPFRAVSCYVSPYRDELTQFYVRGFPYFAIIGEAELVGFDPARFAADLANLVGTTTVRGIEFLTISVAQLEQVIDCPAFAELRGLKFSLSDRFADRSRTIAVWKKLLVSSPAARRIEQFQAREQCWPEIMTAFASSESFRALRRYELPYLEGSPAEIRAWLGAGWAQTLQYVHAFASEEPEKSAAIAAGLTALPELHSLVVSGQIAEVLAHVPAGGFPRLASLRVAGITINHFRELLQTDWFERLRALNLGGFGDQALSALAKHPVAKNLYRLQLHHSKLGKNGLRTLAKPGAFPNLIALDLAGCVSDITGKKSATPEEVRAFLSGLSLPRLQVLNLSKWYWSIGDDEARALASNTGLPALKYLDLEDGKITDAGKKALADSPLGRAAIKYTRR